MSTDEKLWHLVAAAVAQQNDDAANRSYEQLVRTISDERGGDQKEIAQALQTLARQVESKIDADTAFAFKQKSCAVLLIFNMEARRSGRKPVAAPASTQPDPGTNDLTRRASAAVREEPARSERLIQEIIEELEKRYENNQRDVAAALQKISKQLEADGQGNDAIEFKQRSCAALLKMSMASRRRTMR
ncbi:MAG TPA: hypothetical protein V6C81_24140 [Planktothrix sp.]